MEQITVWDVLEGRKKKWKPIPVGATIIFPAGSENLPSLPYFPTDRFKIDTETYKPDKTLKGTVNRIPATVGFKEWVSGPPGDIYKQYEPVMYMED